MMSYYQIQLQQVVDRMEAWQDDENQMRSDAAEIHKIESEFLKSKIQDSELLNKFSHVRQVISDLQHRGQAVSLRQIHRLTILTTVSLPISLLLGLFGTNLSILTAKPKEGSMAELVQSGKLLFALLILSTIGTYLLFYAGVL